MSCPYSKKHPDIAKDNGPGRSDGHFGMPADGSDLPLNIVMSAGHAHRSQFALRLMDSVGIQCQNGRKNAVFMRYWQIKHTSGISCVTS